MSQISPGPLSELHKELEGISNCTQCHDLGKKVSNAKCLECHKEIKMRVDHDRGYHASAEILQKDCFECHSDHHGRKFEMIRFDEDVFDHDLTGYLLEGQHGVIDCKACHNPDYISDSDLKKRKNTFLGLDQECLSCHRDFHQGKLSDDCISCHNFDAFRPAPGFDHDMANYKLRGKHTDVACIECHKETLRNGLEYQEFTGIKYNDCKSCHVDPHLNHFEGTCTQCHTERSFNSFIGQNYFNHNTTNFTLKASHARIDCFACHDQTSDPELVFEDYFGVEESQCIHCHDDVHEAKFGTNCAKCHNEESFFTLNDMGEFDHELTDYPLQGKHTQVDCKNCHSERYTDPIDFSACKNCHEDYHNGEFRENDITPDCNSCHTLEEGFEYTLYTIEQHQSSNFALEGAHLATPCFACHQSEERWQFRNIGLECIDCHIDIHEGFISEQYYPEKNCTNCHNSENWQRIEFDHNKTTWALKGKHDILNCSDCHFDISSENAILTQTFNTLSSDCIQCHDNVHDTQFEINGITDCTRCHDVFGWSPNNFDHDNTAFPLEGKHSEIDCRACHNTFLDDEETMINYKIEKHECIDCHL